LSLDEKQLYNRYICQEHFSPDYFLNYKNNKLKSNAIPYKYNSDKSPSTSSAGTEFLLFYFWSNLKKYIRQSNCIYTIYTQARIKEGQVGHGQSGYLWKSKVNFIIGTTCVFKNFENVIKKLPVKNRKTRHFLF